MSMTMRHDGQNEEKSTHSATKNLESEEHICIEAKKCNGNLVSDQILLMKTPRSRNYATSCPIFLQNIQGLHITSLNEKYALCCLELISSYAKRSAAWNYSLRGDTLLWNSNNLAETRSRSSCEAIRLAVECPSSGQSSQRVISTSKSPIVQQPLSVNSGARESTASPNGFFIESSHNLQKEATFLDYSFASATSSNSSSSSKSPCSTPSGTYQGMLQCKWKDGLPQNVFTVEGGREIHTANLSRVESSTDKVLDYAYSFYSRKNIQGEHPSGLDLESVGKMLVSSSVSVCSDNSEVVETRFILSSSSDSRQEEVLPSNHNAKKKTRLAKKVRSALRSSQSYKLQPDESEDTIELACTRNSEVAAIVVKDRVFNSSKVLDNAGWGMKFLKKSGNSPSSENSTPPKRAENSPECTTTIDVIIPAGFHGGSRSRNSGPSSLIERWTSGGSCDCGGWDLGCPLTVLSTNLSCHSSNNAHEYSTSYLFIQGLKQHTPVMKMVNIHKGLYYIHFQSTMSILQSFAIATAIIHSSSRVLRSRLRGS